MGVLNSLEGDLQNYFLADAITKMLKPKARIITCFRKGETLEDIAEEIRTKESPLLDMVPPEVLACYLEMQRRKMNLPTGAVVIPIY